ncbi:MAG: hypothetical protein ABIJ31_05645 [Pseudomonadota bacterium]
MKKEYIVLVLLVLWLSPAYAHKVNVFAWVEADTVYTQSKFSGGKLAQGGTIFVYDDKKNLLLKGVTNDQGEFSFKIPGKTALHIELDATMGHANSWDIPLEEILQASGEPPAPTGSTLKNQPDTGEELKSNTAMTCSERQPAAIPGITLSDIRKIVEQALDTRLKPMNRMLVESTDHKPDMNDIMGGIGYILGLAGVGAYFHYRSRIKELEKR